MKDAIAYSLRCLTLEGEFNIGKNLWCRDATKRTGIDGGITTHGLNAQLA